MRNFTTEDFSGGGQYLIRNDKPAGQYTSPGFMSTVMYKVGFDNNNLQIGTGQQITTMISMADGWTRCFHYLKDNKGEIVDYTNKVIWQGEKLGDNLGKQRFVDYLNNPELSQEYRFATQEEVVRVVMYQSSRWR